MNYLVHPGESFWILLPDNIRLASCNKCEEDDLEMHKLPDG